MADETTRARLVAYVPAAVVVSILTAGSLVLMNVGRAMERMDQIERTQGEFVRKDEQSAHNAAVLRELNQLNQNLTELRREMRAGRQ